MSNVYAERLGKVRRRIAAAAAGAGRDPGEIKLIAVSKTHQAPVLREAIGAGIRTFGENKVQEGLDKIAEIGREDCEWHLIGHLQKNKARKAVKNFDVIHTLDSQAIAERLERICGEEGVTDLRVLIQVDLANEETKSGVPLEDLGALVDTVLKCGNLDLRGFMVIPPYFDDVEHVRPYFRELRKARDEYKEKGFFASGVGDLSMGMSHDFETAIEEGATMIRVGTALFGPRG